MRRGIDISSTALYIAMRNDNIKLVKILLDSGAQVYHRAMCEACRKPEIFKLLPIDKLDLTNSKYVYIAARHGNFDITESILERGGTTNYQYWKNLKEGVYFH